LYFQHKGFNEKKFEKKSKKNVKNNFRKRETHRNTLTKVSKNFRKTKKIETSDDREFFGTSKNIQSQNLSFNFLFIREELSK